MHYLGEGEIAGTEYRLSITASIVMGEVRYNERVFGDLFF